MSPWSRGAGELAVGTRTGVEIVRVAEEVRRTVAPVRAESYPTSAGSIADEARELGIRSSVGCPILVSGRLWGVIAASRTTDEPFPPKTEKQISRFTEIVTTAILTNAESRAELAASRARVVTAGDEIRRRLGRDLHDGAQQRLVSLALDLRMAQEMVPKELEMLRDDLSHAVEELSEAVQQLRELSLGLYPTNLSNAGLGQVLQALARRCAIEVELHIDTASRYERQVEVSAYYVVSEALANTIKHARASRAEVIVKEQDSMLSVCIRDDGVGGADMRRGSGLIGLRDRVETIGGRIEVSSPVGHGTKVEVFLPIHQQEALPDGLFLRSIR